MTTRLEIITYIELEKLIPFREHPLQARDDEQMKMLVESVRSVGVLVSVIARSAGDGSYELIAGHQRKHACELTGLPNLPVIVRDVNRDMSTVMMVDRNFQREEILPSERAKVYMMKLEAIKRQGARTDLTFDQVGQKLEVNAADGQNYEVVPKVLYATTHGRDYQPIECLDAASNRAAQGEVKAEKCPYKKSNLSISNFICRQEKSCRLFYSQ